MKLELTYLTDSEIQTLHESALKILGEIGMSFPAAEALEVFEKAGAEIVDNDTVRIHESLVEKALKTAPKRKDTTLFALNPDQDVRFDCHDPGIACMTMATGVIDRKSGEMRPATDNDLENLVRIADRLENVKVNGGLITPQDVEHTVCDWYTWANCMKHTTKHITGGVLGYRGVHDAVEMGSIAAGGRDGFLERPHISGWVLTLPPLGMDTASLEAMMEMNRYHIPIMLSSGPILGNTSPVTIPGMIAQAHAEILGCITLSQLVNPGAPLVYTSFARGMNMKTSNISMAGPEFAVLKVAMAQMGLWLDFPIRMPSMLRDSKILDAQAGFETGMVGTISSLKADIMDAMQLDTDMVVDYPDLVFCDDCMAFIRHAARELEINEQSAAYDVIKAVGPGGNFLGNPHTFQNFKTELWHSDLFDHDNRQAWESKGSKTIRDAAMEKVSAMLEEKAPAILSTEQEAQIDRVVQKAEDDLAGH